MASVDNFPAGAGPVIAMDAIIISGIECFGYGGVSEAERAIGQRYRIDLELFLDTRPAAASDAIEDAVHYGHVHDAAVAALRSRPFNLLESAADRIAVSILDEFPVDRVKLRLSKLLPPIDGVVASAAVEIDRVRSA